MQLRPDDEPSFPSDDEGDAPPVPPSPPAAALPSEPFVAGNNFSGADVDAWVAWFSFMHNHTREATNQLLFFMNALHSGHAKSSATLYKLLKQLETYGISLQVYDCCEKDCMVFRGEDDLLTQCKVCDGDRFKDTRHTVPVKKFFYLPLIKQLEVALRDPDFCRLVEYCYQREAPFDEDASEDVFDGTSWPSFMENLGFRLAPGLLGLVFALCLDGFNPFDKSRTAYSLWPAFLKILNFAPHLRNKTQFMFLIFITQGPDAPKHLNPFLDILVEELLLLHSPAGIRMWHGLGREWCSVRAGLLYLCGDYPGSAEVRCLRAHAARSGCCCCKHRSLHVLGLSKQVWSGACLHLPPGHALRPRNSMPTPEPKTDAFIKEGCQKLRDLPPHSPQAAKERIFDEYGITGISSLTKLPYFNLITMSVSDIMHWIENIGTQLMVMLSLKRAQKKPEEMAAALGDLGLDSGLLTATDDLPWAMNPDNFSEVERRLKAVRRPPGFNLEPLKVWQHPKQVKAAGWVVFFKYLALYIFDGLLQPAMQTAFNAYVRAIVAILEPVQFKSRLLALHVQVCAATTLLENELPLIMHTLMMVHQPVHIVMTLIRFGPCHASWMFGFERLMAWLKRLCRSRSQPEMSICQSYMRNKLAVGAVSSTWSTGSALYIKDVALGDVEDGEGSYEFVPRVMRSGAERIGSGSKTPLALTGPETHQLRVCYGKMQTKDNVWGGIMGKWELEAEALAADNRRNNRPHVLPITALPFVDWFGKNLESDCGVLNSEEQRHVHLFGENYTRHRSVRCNGAVLKPHMADNSSNVFCNFIKVNFVAHSASSGWRYGRVLRILEHDLFGLGRDEEGGRSDGPDLFLKVEWFPPHTVETSQPNSPFINLTTSAADKQDPFISAHQAFCVPVAISTNGKRAYLLGESNVAAPDPPRRGRRAAGRRSRR